MDGDNEINPSETLAEKDSQKLRENGDDSKSYSLKVTVEEANSFYQNILIEKKLIKTSLHYSHWTRWRSNCFKHGNSHIRWKSTDSIKR